MAVNQFDPSALLKILTDQIDHVSNKTRDVKACCLNGHSAFYCTNLHSCSREARKAVGGIGRLSGSSGKFTKTIGKWMVLFMEALNVCQSCNCPNYSVVNILKQVSQLVEIGLMEISIYNFKAYGVACISIRKVIDKLQKVNLLQQNYWDSASKEDPICTMAREKLQASLNSVESALNNWNSREQMIVERTKLLHNVSAYEQLNAHMNELRIRYNAMQRTIAEQNTVIQAELLKVLERYWASQGLIPKLTPFGSRISGLASEHSDLDVSLSLYRRMEGIDNIQKVTIVMSNQKNSKQIPTPKPGEISSTKILNDMKAAFARNNQFRFLVVLPRARVPILRLKQTGYKVEVDICIENQLGIENTLILQDYIKYDERVYMLLLAVKTWISNRCCNQAKNGTLSTFSWCMLVLYYLTNGCNPPVVPSIALNYYGQIVRNQIIAGEVADTVQLEQRLFQFCQSMASDTKNTLTAAELLLGFFAFYGCDCKESFQLELENVDIRRTSRNSMSAQQLEQVNEDNEDEEEAGNDDEVDGEEEMDMQEEEPSQLEPIVQARRSHRKQPKITRFVVIDPFLGIDLGRTVTQEGGQHFMLSELRRALYLLTEAGVVTNKDIWQELMEDNPLFPDKQFSICATCKDYGHTISYCPRSTCNKCRMKGHRREVCPAIACLHCGWFSHEKDECPNVDTDLQQPQQQPPSPPDKKKSHNRKGPARPPPPPPKPPTSSGARTQSAPPQHRDDRSPRPQSRPQPPRHGPRNDNRQHQASEPKQRQDDRPRQSQSADRSREQPRRNDNPRPVEGGNRNSGAGGGRGRGSPRKDNPPRNSNRNRNDHNQA